MIIMGLTRLETETVINFNDAESTAYISTRQQTIKTKMRKLGVEPDHKQADYECYEVPKRWIKISPPRRVSEKQREHARQLGKKYGFKRDSALSVNGK